MKAAWLQNPVVLKEMRARMRGSRPFVILTAYLVILGALIELVYLLYAANQDPVQSAGSWQSFGKTIFALVAWMELVMIIFIAPGLTAGAVSSEREHQTYDLLRTTLLPARALVWGKFFSALVFVLLLLFATVPLQSLAFLFGGVTPGEVFASTLMLVVTAAAFCAAGIFFSSFIRRTRISTILSYAFTLVMVFGLPTISLIALSLASTTLLETNALGLTPTQEMTVLGFGWLLVSTNPLTAAVASEILLITQQELFFASVPLGNTGIAPLVISPWISFSVLYLILSAILLWSSVVFVQRPER